MVEIELKSNSIDKVVYNIYNYDISEYVNTITVDKQKLSYNLSNGQKISNHYESAAFRLIIKCIEAGTFPNKLNDGWG